MQKEKLRSFEVAAAEISFLIHATEDRDHVVNLISSILLVNRHEFESENLLGHWGNEIAIIKCRLNGKFANDVASIILNSLDTFDRKKMLY